MVRIELHSGLVVEGIVVKQPPRTLTLTTEGVIYLLTDVKKVRKEYLTRKSDVTKFLMANGINKVRYQSHDATYTETEKKVIATVFPSTIKKRDYLG